MKLSATIAMATTASITTIWLLSSSAAVVAAIVGAAAAVAAAVVLVAAIVAAAASAAPVAGTVEIASATFTSCFVGQAANRSNTSCNLHCFVFGINSKFQIYN